MRKSILPFLEEKSFHNVEVRSHELFYTLPTLDEKTSCLSPSLFLMETFYVCDFGFGEHREIL
jgi:hypothetical protein